MVVKVDLSILIVNWNTKEHLLNCLESIRNHPPSSPFEVIVIDNASADGSYEAAMERFPEFKVIQSGSNLGYAEGNNLAFSKAAGDFCLTLNPDTIFEDDSLEVA